MFSFPLSSPLTQEFSYIIFESESPGILLNLCCNFLIVPGNAIGKKKSMQRIFRRGRGEAADGDYAVIQSA